MDSRHAATVSMKTSAVIVGLDVRQRDVITVGLYIYLNIFLLLCDQQRRLVHIMRKLIDSIWEHRKDTT
jgi:hypothetical protein